MAPPNREVQSNQTNDSTKSGDDQKIDASSIFLAQVQSDRAPKTAEPKESRDVAAVNDRALTAVKPDQTPVYPNQLIAEARSAGKEMASYLQGGRDTNEKIQYKDATGQMRETTVGERVEQLKTLINQDCQNAITAANELIKNNPNLEKNYNAVTAQLQTAAQQAGLDYHDPNFRKQIANNPELTKLAQEQETLNSARMLPGTAMLTYAMLKAEGLTENPAQSMEAFRTTGAPKPSDKELNDAFMLVSQAGRTNPEVASSPLYAATNNAIKTDYAVTQNEKGKQIIGMLKEADQMQQYGDSTKAGELYEKAWKFGEGIDQKFLAAQLKLQDNQSNPQVAQALVGILADVKEARMHYADYLVKQGKYDDALPIALSVGADTPEFAQADSTYNKLVNDATFGKSMPQGDLQAQQAKFYQLMQDDKNPNRFTEAQNILNTLQKNFADTSATLDRGKVKLDAEKTSIDGKLSDLEKKKDSTDPEEYKIEKARLEQEKAVIDQVQKQNEELHKQGSYLKYMAGTLAYAQDDRDKAHALFEQFKNEDPELAKNKELNVDALLDATKHQNWFQRNWHAIATVGAVVAGVAVGIGVGCLTGPGGIAAGIGTTGAILAAVGGGAVAGGLVFTGTKAAALGTDTVTWKDFREGALIGGASAVPVMRIGTALAPEAGGLASLAATAETGTGAFARFGLTGKSLAYGASYAGAKEGMEVAFDGKSLGDAAKSFAWEAPVNALTFGQAGRATSLLGVVGNGSLTNALPAAAEFGMQGYIDWNDHVLDPSKASEQQKIWERYSQVNPSLVRPNDVAPASSQPQGQNQEQAPPPRKMTDEEIKQRRDEEISDAPVGQ